MAREAPRGLKNMLQDDFMPETRPEGVRTLPHAILIGSPCPVCREHPLQGRQTVCSARCRARRHRQRRAESRRAQIHDVRSLLQAALTRLEDA